MVGGFMADTLLKTLSNGFSYSKEWPVVAEFNALFPENKVIEMTKFGQKYVSAFAVASLMLQLQIYGSQQLIPALAVAFFILALPLQGFYWLGVRSQSQLPPQLQRWYQDVAAKMQQSGVEQIAPAVKPRYTDLAILLNLALKKLDRAFLKQWF